jgi:hypothetical protein
MGSGQGLGILTEWSALTSLHSAPFAEVRERFRIRDIMAQRNQGEAITGRPAIQSITIRVSQSVPKFEMIVEPIDGQSNLNLVRCQSH